MRRKPLKYPKIKTLNKFLHEYLTQSRIRLPAAYYRRAGFRNFICFMNMPYVSEDLAIATLLHEETHWAQGMFLTRKEYKRTSQAYKKAVLEQKTPFVEWINPFYGGYDMREWEKKYGEKYYIV